MALRKGHSSFQLASQCLNRLRSTQYATQVQYLHGATAAQRTAAQPELEDHVPQASREHHELQPSVAPPRWMVTPEKMKGNVRLNVPKDPSRTRWTVNEDTAVLDQVYERLLGRDGPRLLPDELKWLAVTHKSFDQGRRGFNDKLTYFGRRILVLEATRYILNMPESSKPSPEDPHGREPFEHPDLVKLDNFVSMPLGSGLSLDAVASLASQVGLVQVLRWKPRMPENLSASGVRVVLNGALYAIVGAISLHNGAEVASKVAREKILKRLFRS